MFRAQILRLSGILVLASLAFPARAALSDGLAAVVATAPADSLVSVWIRPQPIEAHFALSAALRSLPNDREVRYREGRSMLESQAAQAQAGILAHLNGVVAAGHADRVTGRWIASLIEAEVAVSELARLASRRDVAEIVIAPVVTSIAPVDPLPAPRDRTQTAATSAVHLQFINAPLAWAQGYTGAGRIVCSFDTGVEGFHPYLASSWRGLTTNDSAAAWFDPVDREPFPHTYLGFPGITPYHGTHTLGLMVGKSGSDTIGVAPGAEWIAAATIDIPGASILGSFEWAADPDGNPNTVSDLPDVISHSWGFATLDCADIFYDIVDNVEALGIVNIFAAGNEGAVTNAIRNPANGDRDTLDMFAVGALGSGMNAGQRAGFSSVGPSQCNGGTKPNISAPGQNVRSAWPLDLRPDSTAVLSGTSMATPLVAGAVALLRQKNPNATVREIKEALLAGVQITGIGNGPGTFPNNEYGWGALDVNAALNALSPNAGPPNVRVYSFATEPINPGDLVTSPLILQNLGGTATTVTATVTGSNPWISVISGAATYGTLSTGDTSGGSQNWSLQIDPSTPGGTMLMLPIEITGDGFTKPAELSIIVEPRGERSLVTHNSGRIQWSVTNFGAYGAGPESRTPAGGVGFRVDNGPNEVWEMGLVIGTGADRISSGVHSVIFEPELDFAIAPGGNLFFQEPGPDAEQQTFSIFNDSKATDPIGVEITQRTLVRPFDGPSGEDRDFILLEFVVRNTSSLTVTDLHVGLFTDWDAGGSDTRFLVSSGGWDATGNVLWTADNGGSTPTSFRGMALINASPASAWTNPGTTVYNPGETVDTANDGFTDAEKWDALTDGLATASQYATGRADLVQLLSGGPYTLAPGESVPVRFVIAIGNNLTGLRDAVARATAIATDVPDDPDTPLLPQTFALAQNYPNPFNPNTTIAFTLPTASEYRLEIFNLLGQRVDAFAGRAAAGSTTITWDARDRASGVYLYRLTAGENVATRKMLLLK